MPVGQKVFRGMSALGKDQGAQWTFLLVFTIVLSFGFGFMVGTRFQIAGPNTATQTIPCGTYSGTLGTTTGGGQFPVQSGENQVGNGIAANPYEIFEKTRYAYSWSDAGQSEPIVVEGRILGCGLIAGSWDDARYAFFISIDGGQHWNPFKQSDLGGVDGNELSAPTVGGTATYNCFYGQNQQWCINQGAANLKTGIIRIHGVDYLDAAGTSQPIIDGAWLKVVIQVRANQWFDMAYDIAQLYNALPGLNWVSKRSDANGYPLYQVGDTATLNINVPVVKVGGTEAKNATAYFLTITLGNTNSVISGYSMKPITDPRSQVTFPVTMDMYTPGAPNNLVAEIDSQIFASTYRSIGYVDNSTLAPALVNVVWNKPFYREGESVTINVTGQPNAVTKSPIVNYYVLAFVGGVKEFDGFSQVGTVTFTATSAGLLTVQARVYDAAGRGSGTGTFQTTVGAAIGLCVQYPNAVECTGAGGGPFDWGIVILAFLLFVGIGLFYTAAKSKGNPGWRIPVIIVSLGLVAVTVIILAPMAVNAIITTLTPRL